MVSGCRPFEFAEKYKVEIQCPDILLLDRSATSERYDWTRAHNPLAEFNRIFVVTSSFGGKSIPLVRSGSGSGTFLLVARAEPFDGADPAIQHNLSSNRKFGPRRIKSKF